MDKVAVAFGMYLNIIALYKQQEKKKRRKRRWAVRPINRNWHTSGYFTKTFSAIRDLDEEQFFIHTRMTKKLFQLLLSLLRDKLRKPRQRISTEERLEITLLFLAHGASMQSIAWSHKLGKTTIWKLIFETCEALWDVLSGIYLSLPTESQYKDIAADFGNLWNLPNCVGAVDGKHIAIKCPKNSGSMYFNYKKTFSIVLMAVCDARYTFIVTSLGSYGSENDAGVFSISDFGTKLLAGTLPLPPSKPLPNCSDREPFPHFFVGDAAFPLGKNLMRPISPPRSREILSLEDNVYNYRISRARRTIENSFGILTTRWRILNTTLEFMPDNTEKIVLTCVALHNFIMLNDLHRWYCPPTFVDHDASDHSVILGSWRTEIQSCNSVREYMSHSRRSFNYALSLRNKLRNYFMNEGAVSFQPK